MTIRNTNRDIDFGFGFYDSERRDKQRFKPKVQILTPREQNSEDKNVYCANCKTRMDHKERLDIYMCSHCGGFVDLKYGQDAEITSNKGDKFQPHAALQHSPVHDPDDTTRPFMKSIKVEHNNSFDQPTEGPKQRVQNIKMKGSPAEAWKLEE